MTMMETALVKRIGFKVIRKLKIVRALVPQRRVNDGELIRDIGSEHLSTALSRMPQILSGLSDPKLLARIEKNNSADWQRMSEVAQNALRHRFDLLGSGLVDLGPRIDWSSDFKSGKSWDKRDYRLQKLVNLNDNSDVKIPWELSRCNHFLPMALAYFNNGDDGYPHEFVNQVVSWAEDNEYLRTVNWSCPMDTAIRCINWLVAYQTFALRHKFSEAFIEFLTIELYKGGKSIYENLEVTGDGHNTNHYLTDLLGLLFLGGLFSGATRPNNWQQFAIDELEKEMLSQVNCDGLDYESSLPYHGLVTEIFLMAHLLSTKSNFQFSEQFRNKLRMMVANLARFTGADGLVDNFGDNDDGRILKLFWRSGRDYRDIIDLGATMFPNSSGEVSAMTPERACFGISPIEHSLATPPPWTSVHLEESGICQLRSRDFTMNFFANPVGTAGLGNHKHNDLLAFTLTYKGTPVFVDPGSYEYTVDEDVRNQFRSTRSHNTVVVDESEQNRMVRGLLFLLRSDGTPKVLNWQSNGSFDLVIAEHDCYGRLDDPVVHRRSVYLCKTQQIILIRDELSGNAPHRLQFNFHADNMRIEARANHLIYLKPAPSGTGLIFANCDESRPFQIGTNWVSPSYGVQHPAISLSTEFECLLPYTTTYAIVPHPEGGMTEAMEKMRVLRQRLQW